jgi:hypothetical protein
MRSVDGPAVGPDDLPLRRISRHAKQPVQVLSAAVLSLHLGHLLTDLSLTKD